MRFIRKYNTPERLFYFTNLFFMCSILLWRGWSRITVADLYAEDGALFIKDALEAPFQTLFQPYTGYFHTIPRFIAIFIVSLVPVKYFASAICIVSTVIVGFIFSLFTRKTYRWLVPIDSSRTVIALLFCLAPALSWNILGNLANLHWSLFFALALLLLKDEAESFSIIEIGFVFLICASEGSTVLLLPLSAYRSYVRQKNQFKNFSRDWMIAGIIILFFALSVHLRGKSSLELASVSDLLRGFWVSLLDFQVTMPLLGQFFTSWTMIHEAVSINILKLGILFALYLTCIRSKKLRLFCLFEFATILLPLLILIARPDSAHVFYSEEMAKGGHKVRYAFIPFLSGVLLWSVVLIRGFEGRWYDRFRKIPLSFTLFALIAFFTGIHKSTWRIDPYSDSTHWPKYAPVLEQALKLGATERILIPIYPKGWFLDYQRH